MQQRISCTILWNKLLKGGTIITDGWSRYNGLFQKGYVRDVKKQKDDQSLLPHIHIVISLLKRWLIGTLQGACAKEHLAYYLDEYTFKFNHRKFKSRSMFFYRLLQNAVQVEPSTYDEIIGKLP